MAREGRCVKINAESLVLANLKESRKEKRSLTQVFRDVCSSSRSGVWKHRNKRAVTLNEVKYRPNCPLDRIAGEWKHKALPHLTLVGRIHLRVLAAVKFHRELWQIRKWSIDSILGWTVWILFDLKSHRFGRDGWAPNLRGINAIVIRKIRRMNIG